MRIRYMSDLHLEFRKNEHLTLPSIDEDLVVLAGDISMGLDGILWAQKEISDRPVIYILGNHEFYRGHFDELIEQARNLARGTNVHFLENDAVTLGGVRFLGCTFWTDFCAFGVENQSRAMHAVSSINDYWQIKVGADVGTKRFITPEDTLKRHLKSRMWLETELAASAEDPCVVITHFGPSMRACSPRFVGDRLNPYFLNGLDHLIRSPVSAWIFGHTHHSGHWDFDGIPLLSNQRGYPREGTVFDWDRMIEVEGNLA